MQELPYDVKLSKDEQEIIGFSEELRLTKDPDERRVKADLFQQRMISMKQKGMSFKRVSAFFRKRSDDAKSALKAAGKVLSDCGCKE
jgi:hypothetical protein